MEEKAIGVVVRYFAKIGVAAIRITEESSRWVTVLE